ncbi:MAG: YggS family pyridoxal phosphate-dependent enzyme [Roseiflexaceae bacterium]
MDTIAMRIEGVRERIAAAARRAGRSPEQIRLIGVSKTHPPELVAQALLAGLRDFGENRVQEAEPKIAALAAERNAITWHLIGHLQSNKAKRAGALFDVVHSVDSVALAEALARGVAGAAPNLQSPTSTPLAILLQVNVSGEASKDGFDLAGWETRPELLDRFFAEVEQLLALPNLRVGGLMTIAPWGDDPSLARPTFRSAQQLRDSLAQRFQSADWSALSMGMSDDFEVAIAEGATIVRVGRAIFGIRDAQ